MPQTVILQHRLPNGESHFDWMIDQPDSPAEHRLLTFRCQIRPDFLPRDGLIVEKLPDHRAIYLSYEGPLSQGRGIVSRVGEGTAQIQDRNEKLINLSVNWSSSSTRTQMICITLVDSSQALWRIALQPDK